MTIIIIRLRYLSTPEFRTSTCPATTTASSSSCRASCPRRRGSCSWSRVAADSAPSCSCASCSCASSPASARPTTRCSRTGTGSSSSPPRGAVRRRARPTCCGCDAAVAPRCRTCPGGGPGLRRGDGGRRGRPQVVESRYRSEMCGGPPVSPPSVHVVHVDT